MESVRRPVAGVKSRVASYGFRGRGWLPPPASTCLFWSFPPSCFGCCELFCGMSDSFTYPLERSTSTEWSLPYCIRFHVLFHVRSLSLFARRTTTARPRWKRFGVLSSSSLDAKRSFSPISGVSQSTLGR